MQKVTFKQFQDFVDGSLSEEQLNEIWPFSDPKKKAEAERIKKELEMKKKALQAQKDAAWKAAQEKMKGGGHGGAPAARAPGSSPLMSKSTSHMGAGAAKAVERDPYGLAFESSMADIDAELQLLWPKLESGEVDLYDILSFAPEARKLHLSQRTHDYLQHMYDQKSQHRRLHPDDDFEEIIMLMMDDLEADYGK